MAELIEALTQWAISVLSQGGYLGIFLLSVADRIAFQFIPGEVVFTLLGFLVSQARFDFIPALIFTAAGNFIGDIVIYFVAFWGGRPLVEKIGKYFLFSKHDLSHTEKLFKEHGGKLVFWGRFIPLVVTFISIPAGLARMNFKKFSFFTILGSLPRNFILIFLGFKLGENWRVVIGFLERIEFVIIVLLVAAVVWYVYRHLKKKHLLHE